MCRERHYSDVIHGSLQEAGGDGSTGRRRRYSDVIHGSLQEAGETVQQGDGDIRGEPLDGTKETS